MIPKEEVIRVAREAELPYFIIAHPEKLTKAFELVAAREREECAKAVQECEWPKWAESCDVRDVFEEAIRQRGQP